MIRKKRAIALVATLVGLLLLGSALAQIGSASEAAADISGFSYQPGANTVARVTVASLTGTLQGSVILQGRTDYSSAQVTANGQTTATLPDGSFSLELPAGTYNVTVEIPGYLPAQKQDVTVAPGDSTILPPLTLIAGDVNHDGRVDILDLVQIAVAFGSSPPITPEADVLLDGEVNLWDLVLVATNLGMVKSLWPDTAPAHLPELISLVDLMDKNFETGQPAFEIMVEAEYGNNPEARLVPATGGLIFDEVARSNLHWLKEEGYSTVEVPVVGGDGTLLLDSQVLLPKRHPDFDYDSQYTGDPRTSDLRVPVLEAKQHYQVLPQFYPTTVREAHALGMKVVANIESLAHIINRATASGIGGEESALIIAGNLPPPTVAEVLAFIDEVLAVGADGISAEAFSAEYDTAIADHLRAKGVPYIHTGAELGNVWTGYYYSFYPDNPVVADVYEFLHTNDAILGDTNGNIFARARAVTPQPDTAVVVGAYNPVPCDTSLSISDLYDPARSGPEASPIDSENPALADGTPVENCSTALWPNLLLIAAQRQGVDRIELSGDLLPSAQAISQKGLTRTILDRIAAHPAPDDRLPIANIIVDKPNFTVDDGFDSETFLEQIALSLVDMIDDALGAAGYQTVLTYDKPWDGGPVDLTYILTAGGNEETGDGPNYGPPYWTSAQELEPELLQLLDPSVHPGPVFIHPVLGLPDRDNWQEVRSRFGLPQRFSYQNPGLSQYPEYHTSLLSSLPVTPEGDVPEGEPFNHITPDTGLVLGKTVHLVPYGDVTHLGQSANYIGPDEVSSDRVVASGPLRVNRPGGSPEEVTAPYLVTDGSGRFLWTISNIHHEAFSYIVSQAVARATGRSAVLVEPTKAHIWSGRQTFALAYDKTDVVLNLPFQEGELVDITVYDIRSKPVRQERGIPYQGPLRISLDKYSLLVVEPAR